jgi:hypothetical protein
LPHHEQSQVHPVVFGLATT